MTSLFLMALCLLLTGAEVQSQGGRMYYKCPKGFFRAGNKCYYVSEDQVTWREAHFRCQDNNNSTLAVPDRKMQDTNLRYKLNRKKNASYERWIGGTYDWGRGVWVWGTTGKKVKYQSFSRKHPEKSYDWKCIIMDPQSRNRWGIRSCLEEKYYICEHPLDEVFVDSLPTNVTTVVRPPTTQTTKKPPKKKQYKCPQKYFLVGTNCYHASRDKQSWREANFKCSEKDGSNLVILETEKMDRQLRNALKKRKRAIKENWIGGIYNWQREIWIWGFTGCSIWYQDFIKNKAQINEMNQSRGWYCMIMDPAMGYRWGARSCFEKKNYICERPAIRLGGNISTRSGDLRQSNTRQHRFDQSLCDLNNTL